MNVLVYTKMTLITEWYHKLSSRLREQGRLRWHDGKLLSEI